MSENQGQLNGMSEAPARPHKGLRIEHLWLGLPFFLLACKGFIFPLPLLDFWWHLKMGEVIWQGRTIPQTDIFSFTAAGKPFIVHNWLAEILYYLVFQAGGFPWLICMNVLLLLLALVPIYRLCREDSPKLWISVSAASLMVFGVLCNARPQVFSFVLFAWFLWVLSGYRQNRRDRLWILPGLMLLWVNLHGAFVVGLGLTALVLTCELLRFSRSAGANGTLSRRQLCKLAFVFCLCVAATLANPQGFKVYTYIQTVLRDTSSQQFVIEWQPPRVDTLQGALLFYFPFMLTTLVLIYSRLRPDLTDLAIFLGFSIFGLSATRNSVWFLLVSSPICARYLAAWDWSFFRKRNAPALPRGTAGSRPAHSPPSGTRSIAWLNYCVAGLAALILVIFTPWVQVRLNGASLVDSKTPVQAVDFCAEHSLEGNIFHPQVYGDYLIWRLWPRQRSFFDGRVHLFGEAFVRTYQQIFRDSHWEDLLAEFKIRYLLLDKDGEERWGSQRIIEAARGSGNWQVLYEDRLSVLFRRTVN